MGPHFLGTIYSTAAVNGLMISDTSCFMILVLIYKLIYYIYKLRTRATILQLNSCVKPVHNYLLNFFFFD